MIIRIVKMGFKPEMIPVFLSDFEKDKAQIRNFEGCMHLKLIRDVHNPNQFFTYSHWESENHLNNYRNSPLFERIWSATKPKFNQKPEAWSTIEI